MKILITGAKGFVGRNLIENLKNIQFKKNTSVPINIDEIYEIDIDSSLNDLEQYCRDCDFVFNLAGVNRTTNSKEFFNTNVDFVDHLFESLKKYKNKCPVMIASSIQATLVGRYNNDYGCSKKNGEEVAFNYSKETGAKVLVYRFMNLFGKWCRPNYNSVIATFCHNIANDLSIRVDNPEIELQLIYIDDLIDEMYCALQNEEHRCDFNSLEILPNKNGKYCYVPIYHTAKLGKIVELLNSYESQHQSLIMPKIPNGSFEKKLYSTFLSYLPQNKVKFSLKMNVDNRGSFTELIKTIDCGQFSINISKPGVTKGEHWHNTKWEFFIVVSGEALIQERRLDSEEIFEFYVSGDKIEAVHMLPGYTHNIINLSKEKDLITVMWANEIFDSNHPDTFSLKV